MSAPVHIFKELLAQIPELMNGPLGRFLHVVQLPLADDELSHESGKLPLSYWVVSRAIRQIDHVYFFSPVHVEREAVDECYDLHLVDSLEDGAEIVDGLLVQA